MRLLTLIMTTTGHQKRRVKNSANDRMISRFMDGDIVMFNLYKKIEDSASLWKCGKTVSSSLDAWKFIKGENGHPLHRGDYMPW